MLDDRRIEEQTQRVLRPFEDAVDLLGEEGDRRDRFVRPDRSAVIVSRVDSGGGGVSGRPVVHLGGVGKDGAALAVDAGAAGLRTFLGGVGIRGGIGGGGGGEGEEEGRRPGSKWYFCRSLCVQT